MFPRLHDTIACPIAGYDAYTVRLLLNPTGKERDAWFAGLASASDDLAPLASACVSVYGETKATGLDFSTVEASQATLEHADIPDELLAWLFLLPGQVWEARREEMTKKLAPRSATGS